MRKRLISVLITAAVFLSVVEGGGAVQTCLRSDSSCHGPLVVPTLGARVVPTKLAADVYTPVTWAIVGKFATSDGGHPSALREIQLDIDKDVRINSRHHPVCDGGGRKIRAADPRAAEKTCAEALLGRGNALVELAFPGQAPI